MCYHGSGLRGGSEVLNREDIHKFLLVLLSVSVKYLLVSLSVSVKYTAERQTRTRNLDKPSLYLYYHTGTAAFCLAQLPRLPLLRSQAFDLCVSMAWQGIPLNWVFSDTNALNNISHASITAQSGGLYLAQRRLDIYLFGF